MASIFDKATDFVADPFGLGTAGSNKVGKLLGTDNNDAVDSSISVLDEIGNLAKSTGNNNRELYNQYLQQMHGMYGDNSSKYNDAVNALADAIENYGDFSYSGNVNDFMDPAANQRVSAAMSAINNASASGGNRFSSNYLDKVAAKQQALASEEWKSAYDRMMQDRSQQLQEWQTGQQKINNLGTLASVYGADRTALSDAIGNYYSNVANQNNADLEVQSDLAQSKSNLNAGRTQGVGSILGGLGSAIGSIFG